MKVDLYTKMALTVIATCLVVICVRDIHFAKEAQAYGEQVTVVGWSAGPIDVRLERPLPIIPLPVSVVD